MVRPGLERAAATSRLELVPPSPAMALLDTALVCGDCIASTPAVQVLVYSSYIQYFTKQRIYDSQKKNSLLEHNGCFLDSFANLSLINLGSFYRCSSSKTNQVYARRINSLLLVCSLSSHRHSYIPLIFGSRFIDSFIINKKPSQCMRDA
jgi:hypothetical protein